MKSNGIAANERAVLCVLLNDSHAIIPVQNVLDDPQMFSETLHRQVYAAVLELTRQSIVPNVYTVSEKTGIALADAQKLAAGFNTKMSREVLYSADLILREAAWRKLEQAVAESEAVIKERRGEPEEVGLFCAQMLTVSIDKRNDESPQVEEVSKRFDAEVVAVANGSAGVQLGSKLAFLQDKTSGLRPGHIWMITAPYKGRKCVTGDSLVLTRYGWQRIDALCGDVPQGFTPKRVELWTRDGWQYTSHVYRSAASATVKITTAKGYTLEGTPEHPLLVSVDGGVAWRSMGQLLHGDKVALCRQVMAGASVTLPAAPKCIGGCLKCGRRDPRGAKRGLCINCYAQAQKNGTITEYASTRGALTWSKDGAAVRFPAHMTPDLARFIGYLIGEGTLSGDSKVSFTNTTPEIVADYIALSEQLFGLTPRQYGINYHLNNRWLREWLAACGLGYGVAADKQVPWVILQSAPTCQAAFLNALYSADGWVASKKGSCTRPVLIVLASSELIRQVQVMLLGFGIVSARHVRPNKQYQRDFYELSISGDNAVRFADCIGLRAEYKADRLNERVVAQMSSQRRHTSDPIPGMRNVLRAMWNAVPVAQRPLVMPLFDGRRAGDARNVEVTHERARRILDATTSLMSDEIIAPLRRAVADNYLYDEIVSIEAGHAETWDVTVPESASFIANGFVSHNTTLMRNLVLQACRSGASVDVFALEGTETGTYAGLTAMLATEKLLTWGCREQAYLSETFIMRGQRSPDQEQAISEARAELNKWNLRIYDARKGITNPDKLLHFIKRDRFMFDLGVYAVDYLQLLGEGKLFDRIESATHHLQQVTVEERLTALILAQLNEATIWQKDESYSPGVKGGGDPAAAADFLIRTKYDGATAPDILTVQLKLARHARPGTQRYVINPQSGLILREDGRASEE